MKTFSVPVSCCLKCKQPLKWEVRQSLVKTGGTEPVSHCCGFSYHWNGLTLIKIFPVIAETEQEAYDKYYKSLENGNS